MRPGALADYAACSGDSGRAVTINGEGVPTLTKVIAADEPYLSGHYPGNPVYPGVFQLDLALELVESIVGGSWRLTTIANVRFLRPVVPGDTIQVTASDIAVAPVATTRRLRIMGRNQNLEKVVSMILVVTR